MIIRRDSGQNTVETDLITTICINFVCIFCMQFVISQTFTSYRASILLTDLNSLKHQ